MKIEIDRVRRSDKEGLAFTVIARGDQPPYQFKIDIWSIKNSGIYQTRLDGFNYIRLWHAYSIQEIITKLIDLTTEEVLAEAEKIWTQIQKAVPTFPDFPALLIVEYFEAAKIRMLDELRPLADSFHN